MLSKRLDLARKAGTISAFALILAACGAERATGPDAMHREGGRASASAATLSVYISGFTDVNSSSYCTIWYKAVYSGGAGGETFAWSTSGTIKQDYGDTMWAAFPNAGNNYVAVTVTDADGDQASAYLEVRSGPYELECHN